MSLRITFSLVSHTNAGKTTLARTLLSRDIGEVRDAPHVTEFVEEQVLLRDGEGHELVLADTPGFGDSARLVRRMRQQGSPLGWFLSEVWDRWRDRAFWGDQQALRQVQGGTDVVLYLVNASEEGAALAYVEPEMELLAWVGKPVLVLLNQLGPPREPEIESAEVERWRSRLARWPLVREVLPLDAFARCWVQEAALLRAAQSVLPADRQPTMQVLADRWWAQREATFEQAMALLARSLAQTLAQRVPLGGDADAARRALLAGAEARTRDSTTALLALHGLEGRAQGDILARVAAQIDLHPRVHEGKAALWGGMLSGALMGLKADLVSGGLTMGGGMLAGGLLGALGAAGLAKGANKLRGTEQGWAGWPPSALRPLAQAALLRYLAVAHYGRGRGDFVEGESPAFWAAWVDEALAPLDGPLRDAAEACLQGSPADTTSPLLRNAARTLLERLYGPWPAAAKEASTSAESSA